MSNLGQPVNLIFGGKPEHSKDTHTGMKRTCKLSASWLAGLNLEPFFLWGNSAKYCTTVPFTH